MPSNSVATGAPRSTALLLAALFANEIRFWAWVTPLLALIALLKGLRLPGLWAATQAQLNYHDGFVKRGLFGELASALGLPIAHYAMFVAVSAVVFLAFIALLTRWIWLSEVRRIGAGSVLALFGASYCLTYLAHLIGWLDIPAAALAVAAISVGATRWGLIAACAAGVLGVLIHESYLLAFLPLTLLPAFLKSADGPHPLRGITAAAAVAAVVGVITTMASLGAPMTASRADELQSVMAASVDFPLRSDFFSIVLTHSTHDNLLLMRQTMSSTEWWLAQANAVVTFIPTAAVFLSIALTLIERYHTGRYPRLAKAAVWVVFLSPLCLQVLGADIYRWYVLATFCAFMTLTIVCFHYGTRIGEFPFDSNILRNVAVVLIAINMATGTGLLDGYRVNTFTFTNLSVALAHWIAGGQLAPPTESPVP